MNPQDFEKALKNLNTTNRLDYLEERARLQEYHIAWLKNYIDVQRGALEGYEIRLEGVLKALGNREDAVRILTSIVELYRKKDDELDLIRTRMITCLKDKLVHLCIFYQKFLGRKRRA